MSRIRTTASKIFRSETIMFYSTKVEGTTTLKWQPPHKPGEFPLYDMALEVIQKDSGQLRSKIGELRKTTFTGLKKSSVLEEMEVVAEMNRPEVLWAFENGQGNIRTGVKLSAQLTLAQATCLSPYIVIWPNGIGRSAANWTIWYLVY